MCAWRIVLRGSRKVTLIGEEHHGTLTSVAQQVALSRGIPRIQIDMTPEERRTASIQDKLASRMLHWRKDENGIPIETLLYAQREDGIREEFWLDRIAEQQTEGTVLVIGGAVHARPLAEKAQKKGYNAKVVFYPEMPLSQFW